MSAWYQEKPTPAAKLPAWARGLSEAGWERFQSSGLPNAEWEEWKYTSLQPLAEGDFRPAAPASSERLSASDISGFSDVSGPVYRLVLINGRFAPKLSGLEGFPKNASAGSLKDFLAVDPAALEPYLEKTAEFARNPFAALNSACLSDGVFIRIPRGLRLDRPIEILHLSLTNGQATVSHPRHLIVLEDSAQAVVVERYAGEGAFPSLTNAVTEIVTGENAVLDHYKLQLESPRGYHLGAIGIRQKRQSQYRSHNISLGGAWCRNEIHTLLDGEGAECLFNGLYAVQGRQHVDNQTTIDHAQPHCSSQELYKGILGGQATGVFNGRIVVRPDAQKTFARQTNKNLLLSKEAIVNTKPLLEIYANDVKCNHGATIGRLDENQVFYLRSRGIDGERARNLLTYAFAGEVIQAMPLAALRQGLERRFLNQFQLGLSGIKEEAS
jgi:Fe-S cluster assembly protein SufD